MRSLTRLGFAALAVVFIVGATSGAALAAFPTAPEIDGGSLTAGLAVAAAGVLMIRARRSR